MKLLIILLFFPVICFTQTITIDSINPNYPFKRQNLNKFIYLHDNLDTSHYVWIADLTYYLDSDSTSQNVYIPLANQIYRSFGNKALELGANSFKIIRWNRLSKGAIATIKVYKLRENYIIKNRNLFRENKIYIFGVNNANCKNQSFFIKVNGIKVKINPNTYKEYNLAEGEELQIKYNKTKHVIKGQKNKMNMYYTVNYISSTFNPFKLNIVGISTSTTNLAYLLKIYDKD